MVEDRQELGKTMVQKLFAGVSGGGERMPKALEQCAYRVPGAGERDCRRVHAGAARLAESHLGEHQLGAQRRARRLQRLELPVQLARHNHHAPEGAGH